MHIWVILSVLLKVIASGIYYIGYRGLMAVNIEAKVRPGQIKVACVGDSITYGMLLKNWYKNSYPKVLGRLLGDGYCVRNFGLSERTGMETGNRPYIAEKRYKDSLLFQPDLVFLMFGTNDSKAKNWRGAEEFKSQYEKLVLSYCNLSSAPRVCLLTPATPYYRAGRGEGKMKSGIQKPQVLQVRKVEVPLK